MRKKKNGSVLMFVLLMLTAIMIISTVTITAVANTFRSNGNYNTDDDMRLLAESGLNIGLQYLKTIKIDEEFKLGVNQLQVPSDYCEHTLSDYSSRKKYELTIEIYDHNFNDSTDKGVFTIKSVARNKKNSKELTLFSFVTKGGVDKGKFVDTVLNQLVNVLGNPNEIAVGVVEAGINPLTVNGTIYLQGVLKSEEEGFLSKATFGKKVEYSEAIIPPKLKSVKGPGIVQIESEKQLVAGEYMLVKYSETGYKFVIVNGDLIIGKTPIDFNGNMILQGAPITINKTIIYATGKIQSQAPSLMFNNGIFISTKFKSNPGSFNCDYGPNIKANLNVLKKEFLEFINEKTFNEGLYPGGSGVNPKYKIENIYKH